MGPVAIPSLVQTHSEMMEYARLYHAVVEIEAGCKFREAVYIELGMDAWERYCESRR